MSIAQTSINGWLLVSNLFFLGALLASLAVWFWAGRRLLRGERLLPLEVPGLDPESWLAQIRLKTLLASLLLFILLQIGIVMAYSAARRSGSWTVPEGTALSVIPAQDQIILTTFSNLLTVLLLPRLLREMAGIRLAEFSGSSRSTMHGDAVKGLVGCLLVAPLVYGLFALAARVWAPEQHPVFETVTSRMDVGNILLALLSAIVAAPLAEELLFRGVLLGWLTSFLRSRLERRGPLQPPPEESLISVPNELDLPGERPLTRVSSLLLLWVPNLLVSVLFASVHAPQWPAPLPLFVLSLGLGWLTLKTGRLVAPIVMHAVFNGFSTVLTLLVMLSGVVPGQPEKQVPEVLPLPGPAAPAPAPAGMMPHLMPRAVELTGSGCDLGCVWWQFEREASTAEWPRPCRSIVPPPPPTRDRPWTSEAPHSCVSWQRWVAARPRVRMPSPIPPTT